MSKKIYVIDDDPDMVKVLAFRLKSAGLDVKSFTSASEALKALEEQVPDLLILDLQMPEMTGMELEEALLKEDKTRDIPIIFLTGKTDYDLSVYEGKNNRASFIKPCDFEELVQKINAMTA